MLDSGAYERFVACVHAGAGLQDIYCERDAGFAVRPAGSSAVEADETARQRARIEFERLYHHDRDLAEPVDRFLGLAGKRVLEFGCGTGPLAVALARRGAHVVGVDPTRASLLAAHARNACHPHTGRFATVQIDPRPGLPFASGCFDLAITNSVLEFIPERREAYVRELIRVVRAGGHLVISTENGLFPRDYYTRQLLPRLRRRRARERAWPYGLTWFELRSWLRASGRPVRDLLIENRHNSIDKALEHGRVRGLAARLLAGLNEAYKGACSRLGVPAGLLLPYATYFFEIG